MRRRNPPPEKQCTYRHPDGRQCANWRYQAHPTCASHTPDIQRNLKTNPEIAANNQNRYKNGTKASPLKPLRQKEDLLDHLTIHHEEIYLAATGEENIVDLARLSTELTRNALRLTRNLKK